MFPRYKNKLVSGRRAAKIFKQQKFKMKEKADIDEIWQLQIK